MVSQVIVTIIVIAILIKIYAKWTLGWCYSTACLVGKTAIVTGANQGIGYETALDFAKRGARVILACRDEKRAQEACTKIIQETENKNVLVKIVDLSSFESVRKFAKNILETESRLDLLINNAGIGDVDGNKKSVDGHVLIMQVNYFSPFLLTNLLLDLIKRSENGRIVNVASLQAIFTLDLTSKKLGTFPGVWSEYKYTKLCNILFTQELAKRLEGSKITTYSLNPGLVVTDIYKYIPEPISTIIKILKQIYFKTPREGAQTTIYCALEKGIERFTGDYFSDCKRVPAYWNARNPELAKEIWEKTEAIVGLS